VLGENSVSYAVLNFIRNSRPVSHLCVPGNKEQWVCVTVTCIGMSLVIRGNRSLITVIYICVPDNKEQWVCVTVAYIGMSLVIRSNRSLITVIYMCPW
jgi:hypothetical protein